MASSAAIRVYVLEGQYAQLSTLGFPVSLVMELQQGGLRLDNAKWSSRRSDAGFSVSFFWPAALSPRRRRRRQRRRKPRAQPDLKQPNSNCNNYDRPSAATFPARLPTSVLPIPSDAHHPLASSPGPFEGRRRKGLVHTDSACANGHCNLLVFYTVAPTSHVALA